MIAIYCLAVFQLSNCLVSVLSWWCHSQAATLAGMLIQDAVEELIKRKEHVAALKQALADAAEPAEAAV